MCGIGGLFYRRTSAEPSALELEAIRDQLRHRGPDDAGVWRDGLCGLVHTRLAILDLSHRAHQPMVSSSGRYVLSYNGEVYNYRELRDELACAGREFSTTSDTEVVLAAFEAYGTSAVERLQGMFAFAIYDREARKIWLVRDRLGIKPLFWLENESICAFASEPKALMRYWSGSTPAARDIAEFIAFRHLAGEESLLPEIRTLPPGHLLQIDGATTQLSEWWRPVRGRGANLSLGDTIAKAVRKQTVSDAPVGTFLSGGVDSALVTFNAQSVLGSISTFTVGFEEPEWSEIPRARLAASTVGAKAHEICLTPDAYLASLGEAIWHLDAPLNHAHSVHLLALSRYAREHVKVVLTGEGADELFAGYPRYRLFMLGQLLSWLPDTLARQLEQGLRFAWPRGGRLFSAAVTDALEAVATNAAFVPVAEAARLAGVADVSDISARRRELVSGNQFAEMSPLDRLLELERRTYLVSLLQRMDRMTMAAGLEARVPLLDEDVVELALCADSRSLLDFSHSKKPVRELAGRVFGARYANAPKSGFGVPVGSWLRRGGILARPLERLLRDERTRQRGWLDLDRAQQHFDLHRTGVADRSEILWAVLGLELWARICLDGESPDSILM